MGRYPALDVGGADSDLVLAVVDDYSPTAIEEQQDGSLTVYFSDPLSRNHAREAIAHAFPTALISARDVDDGDWARRSQESLGPVTVGRITVAPPWSNHFSNGAGAPPPARSYDDASPPGSAWPQALRPDPPALPNPHALPDPPGPSAHWTVIIQPSMGFGTGHHATTRLCLAALQTRDLTGALVLDVGTGSGVLALAARALGAQLAVGIDNDPDAVACALENLTLNPELDQVVFEICDLQAVQVAALKGPRYDVVANPAPRPLLARDFTGRDTRTSGRAIGTADVITANLTGALLCRAAPTLVSALAPGGSLIVSGLLAKERADVIAAICGQPRPGVYARGRGPAKPQPHMGVGSHANLKLVHEQEEDGWLGLVFEDLRERQLESRQ